MIYRATGPKNTETKVVDRCEVNGFFSSGWRESPGEAFAVGDNAPPTRAEMVQQADKLGIKADGRWSDARLLAEIEKAMQ